MLLYVSENSAGTNYLVHLLIAYTYSNDCKRATHQREWQLAHQTIHLQDNQITQRGVTNTTVTRRECVTA